MNQFIVLSVEEAPGERSDASDLARAYAKIKSLQAENIRMRVELADSRHTINMVRNTIKNLTEVL